MTPTNNPVLDVQRENLTLAALLDLNLTLGAGPARQLVKDVVVSAPEDLMTEQRQQVWRAARSIAVAGGVPTLADVKRRPDLRAIPSDVWEAIEAAGAEAFGADLRENVTQLIGTSQRRRIYQLSQQLALAARSGEDLSGAIAEATRSLSGVLGGNRGRTKGADEFAGAHRRSRAERIGAVKAFYTGIKGLDLKLGGGRLENGDPGPGVLAGKLFIVGAKSGDGKTRFSLNMALVNALKGTSSLYVSGEMKGMMIPKLDDRGHVMVDEDGIVREEESHDVFDALGAMLAGVRSHGAGSKVSDQSDNALEAANAWLAESNMIRVYDDDFNLSVIESLAEECRSEGRGIMFIDNLTHLMQVSTNSKGRNQDEKAEHQWYKNACEELQKIAANTGVTIVAMFQASVSDRVAAGAAPRENELGASRGIAQAASYIVTLGRDADRERDGDVSEAEIRVLKVRYPRRGGRKGLIRGFWRSSTGTWVSELDLDRNEIPERETENLIQREERKLRDAESKKQATTAAKEIAKAKLAREKAEATAAQAAADREAEETEARKGLWRQDRQAGGAQ